MKYFLIFFFLLPLVLSLEERDLKALKTEWKSFKATYRKSYSSSEEQLRWTNFMANVQMIEAHNKNYKLGTVKYKLGINQFSDMSDEEYLKYIHADKEFVRPKDPVSFQTFSAESSKKICSELNGAKACYKIPEKIDWRKRGAVTPVKDQGGCGSCWAFATIGAMESQNFLKTRKLIRLSEQQLIDCSLSYGNMGCNYGYQIKTYEYAMDVAGINSEKSYPYEAKTLKCRYDPKNNAGVVKNYIAVNGYNETKLKIAIGTIGPHYVEIYASSRTFGQYKTGIYNDPTCSRTVQNHAVLAVGYGTENGTDYWILKNSWGETWGDKGYIKMARNANNICGIASYAGVPLPYK